MGNIKYTNNDRSATKKIIADVLKAFANEPVRVKDIIALLPADHQPNADQLIVRMAKSKNTWPQVRAVDRGRYMWDSKVKVRKATPVIVKPTPAPVVESPKVSQRETWETITQVKDSYILKHSDGTVWVAKPLKV